MLEARILLIISLAINFYFDDYFNLFPTYELYLDLQTGFENIFGSREHIFHVLKENISSEMLGPESYLSSHWLLTSVLLTILIYFPHMNVIQTYRQGLHRYVAFGNIYFMFLKKITLVRCQRQKSYLSSHWLLTSVLMTISIYLSHMNNIQAYGQGFH